MMWPTAWSFTATTPDLVVLRTFSKAYGLASLRAGFMVARPVVAQAARKTALSFGVNGVPQLATSAPAVGWASSSGEETMGRLTEAPRALIDASEHATVATIEPDGQPQLSVVWVKTDGDDVVFSTVVSRRKHTNLLRDPSVTLLVFGQALARAMACRGRSRAARTCLARNGRR
jgi:aspartate/methionine/tyrosine aminotransferase